MSFFVEGVFVGKVDINSITRQILVVFSIIGLLFGKYFYGIVLLPVKKQNKYDTEND